MKYDYTKAFRLINNVPNLHKTFENLPTTRTTLKLRSEKFTFAVFFVSGVLVVFNLFNIEHRFNALDVAHNYRVLPDYITGTRFNSYRKERKSFVLY